MTGQVRSLPPSLVATGCGTVPGLLEACARQHGGRPALADDAGLLDYSTLASAVASSAALLAGIGVDRGDRVLIVAHKRISTVVALLAAMRLGAIAVPVLPQLRDPQLAHVLADCSPCVVVEASARLVRLREAVPTLPAFVPLDPARLPAGGAHAGGANADGAAAGEACPAGPGHGCHEGDPAAMFYTSGSTGMPKGVVVSHRNLVAGAASVATYLEHRPDDRLLVALPLSFDAGLSQLTSAWMAGALAVLHAYALPHECLRAMARHAITGMTAVPPLWLQLAELEWGCGAASTLRYVASTGGAMPASVLERLRQRAPAARVYLMYGLTEAFRSTYLPPEELDRRPGSIGRAIPNAEVLVVREDGTPCAPGEVGELVHRGPTVALGYWNDPTRTAERFRPWPSAHRELPGTERAVWSGDLVRRDEDGFLWFVGRRDEQIKTRGFRVSPTEVELVAHAAGGVGECAAWGRDDARLGQAIVLAVRPAAPSSHAVAGGPFSTVDARGVRPESAQALATRIRAHCAASLPAHMVPAQVIVVDAPLPRSGNGKIDRRALAETVGAKCADDGPGCVHQPIEAAAAMPPGRAVEPEAGR